MKYQGFLRHLATALFFGAMLLLIPCNVTLWNDLKPVHLLEVQNPNVKLDGAAPGTLATPIIRFGSFHYCVLLDGTQPYCTGPEQGFDITYLRYSKWTEWHGKPSRTGDHRFTLDTTMPVGAPTGIAPKTSLMWLHPFAITLCCLALLTLAGSWRIGYGVAAAFAFTSASITAIAIRNDYAWMRMVQAHLLSHAAGELLGTIAYGPAMRALNHSGRLQFLGALLALWIYLNGETSPVWAQQMLSQRRSGVPPFDSKIDQSKAYQDDEESQVGTLAPGCEDAAETQKMLQGDGGKPSEKSDLRSVYQNDVESQSSILTPESEEEETPGLHQDARKYGAWSYTTFVLDEASGANKTSAGDIDRHGMWM